MKSITKGVSERHLLQSKSTLSIARRDYQVATVNMKRTRGVLGEEISAAD